MRPWKYVPALLLIFLLTWGCSHARPQQADGKPAPSSGPTFTVADKDLHSPTTIIAYGDTRFTDPANTDAANPAARRALVAKIASMAPDAVQMSGDVPYAGGRQADYDVYKTETAAWRAGHLRIYPALGNHEFAKCSEADCLDHWWTAFPELRGMRWYSVGLGKRVYLINLDSTLPLTEGAPQRVWLQQQLEHLPAVVDFAMISLHHPPVADIQTRFEVDHNPRPNEIALRDYLQSTSPKIHAAIIVTAGHIHNYERFEQSSVVYLVSGGGGAHPYEVDRTPIDKYQATDFPNFHYVLFTLGTTEMKATMYRLADPNAAQADWQARDKFVVMKK